MSDYSEHGAIPVEDASVEDPPTVDEVLERQRRDHPEQAETSMLGQHPPLPQDADLEGDNGGA